MAIAIVHNIHISIIIAITNVIITSSRAFEAALVRNYDPPPSERRV